MDDMKNIPDLNFSIPRQRFTQEDIQRMLDSKIPKEHQWLLYCAAMKKKGYKLRYNYGKQSMERPMKMAYDHEKGGIAPVRPDSITIVETRREGRWSDDTVVGDIDFKRQVDPNLMQSLNILKIVEML